MDFMKGSKPIQGLDFDRFLLMDAVKVAMKVAMKFYGWKRT